jgi:hypothetical protein
MPSSGTPTQEIHDVGRSGKQADKAGHLLEQSPKFVPLRTLAVLREGLRLITCTDEEQALYPTIVTVYRRAGKRQGRLLVKPGIENHRQVVQRAGLA